ncbi:MAG: CinA family nicotinamide mononucleotide deamidase-related protein [Deltaproteobacteria bacterium]|nr:CinA family nicotinamide mononucleotide deamidase-related protein [Deltaproteobacteria bacterium]MCB9786034.1 CinA family nicotinamide mononucleotide deamidase-related protein [Deltaproteobacteria bacterium]
MIAAEIITIGDELLNGDLADTNTARLGALLRARGLGFGAGQTVRDDPARIAAALALAASRAALVLVTGGLGPTEDDVTMQAAAAFAGVKLREDEASLARIRERFASRGYPMTPNNRRQALIPEGASALENRAGTAPGVRMEVDGTTFFFFPGVPLEVDALAADHLLPWLSQRVPAGSRASHTFKTFGKTESQVATLLEPLPRAPDLHVAYRAHFPTIQVTLHVDEPDAGVRSARLEALSTEVRRLLGPIVFSEAQGGSLAEAVVRALAGAHATLALAESCTGGLATAMITEVPGASEVLVETAVTYSNDAKTRRLGVSEALLAEHGAVSEACARAMAEGIRAGSGAQLGVAITGIAGPGGGSADKPVGTVHIALASEDGTRHRALRLPFDRARNRVVSAFAALDMVRLHLNA